MELQERLGRPLTPPIPLDLIAEHSLKLDFLWDDIEELPGETILGGFCPDSRQIILNDRHRDLFLQKPGLERSTKGHEMGHWDLYLRHTDHDHPRLIDNSASAPMCFRGCSTGNVAVLKALMTLPDGRELVRRLHARADDPDTARAVNRYAAALSMPADVVRAEVRDIDRTRWANLYRLAERFEVTITALKVRLEQLDLLALGEDGKTLYKCRAEAAGQGSLF